MPKRPPPYGSLFNYEKPEPQPSLAHQVKQTDKHFGNEHLYGKMMLMEEQAKVNNKINVENEAFVHGESRAENKRINTTDIDEADPNIENRLENFAEISRRLKEHLIDMGGETKGSDLRTANYLRKLNLMARKGIFSIFTQNRFRIGY